MKIFSNRRTFTYIKRQISIKLKDKIMAISDTGLGLENTYERAYPHDELFSHIIGNVNIDNDGLSGIERGMNKEILSEISDPIQLSLDVRIQELLRENLLKSLETYGAKQASAILMNVQTGEILSLVSLPDFHPKNVGVSLQDSKYNNHITFDVYEQGSVFKVFTSSLAIDNGFADIDPIPVYDVGTPFKIGDRTIREEFIFQKYVKFSDILVLSSNIASAKVGLELGAKKQQDFYKKLGLFERVKNIQIPELGSPIFKSSSAWDNTITATSAYGYGLSITPLHTIVGFNAMVNNGIFLNPTLLKINNESPNTPEEIFLKNNERIVSLSTSKLLRKYLRSTITKDKANYIDDGGLKIGGKTGTSEKLVDGKYNSELLRTIFLVTFPIDSPKYSLLVMLDEPTHNAVGYNCRASGCNVVPLTKDILKKLAVYMVLD
jgi:cell division protein FtsI (penicillin-binding protein 3)